MQPSIKPIALIMLISFVLGAFTTVILTKGPITAENVKHAGNLIGIDFTQSEIDSMLPGLEEHRSDYLANREDALPNSMPPTLYFDPHPTNFKSDRSGKKNYISHKAAKVPTNKEELAFYTVAELAYLLKTKAITSVELTTFFLDRLKKYDSKLKCVISLTEELAMAQAKKADAEIQAGNYKGPLHGIPYGAKDLLATKKYKTTWGASPYKDQSFDYDATVIQKLEEAGAVLIAKLTLGALAWGDVWFDGQTRNPWDLENGSSGSSAGSAAAVAAGLVPFAIGTETLGSIVSPSTVCGATGLRPTFGRVSRYGAMTLSWTMDKIGPICRTANDCALVFNFIHGTDPKDRTTVQLPFTFNPSINLKALKIGYVKSDFDKDYAFKEQDAATLQLLRKLGVQLVPIELPKLPNIGFILDAEAAAAFDELTLSGKDDALVRQIKRAWPNTFRTARLIPAVEYIQANRKRGILIEEMAKVFDQIDMYIHPSWASSSLQITNFTGHPSVSVPNGFKEGKPTSISITGQLYEEGAILSLAQALQTRTRYFTKKPKLDGEADK